MPPIGQVKQEAANQETSTPNEQVKQEAVKQETSTAFVVDGAALPVTKMAIEFDKNMYDCLFCSQPLHPPVLKCKDGHGACGSCAELHSGNCHLCTDGSMYEHIRWLDSHVMAAKVRCPNQPFGCQISVTYFLAEEHLRLECLHAPCNCPEPGCVFHGSPPMLYEHLKEHHVLVVTSIALDNKIDLEIGEAERLRLLATENGEHMFLLVITEVVGGGREVRLVRVWGNHAVPCGYWCKMWTNGPIDPASGDMRPVMMVEHMARSCGVLSEEAVMKVGGRFLSVQLLDMHPGGGFALRARITRYQLKTADEWKITRYQL